MSDKSAVSRRTFVKGTLVTGATIAAQAGQTRRAAAAPPQSRMPVLLILDLYGQGVGLTAEGMITAPMTACIEMPGIVSARTGFQITVPFAPRPSQVNDRIIEDALEQFFEFIASQFGLVLTPRDVDVILLGGAV